MDYLTIGFIALFALRFSNADGGLTKKSGTIIIAGGGGHAAPYPVPVPVPIPVHHGYQQGYQAPQHYGHHHIQPYGQVYGQQYDQHPPAQNNHHQYGHHPHLIVLPIFTPRTHHEGYGFGESHNFGQYNFQGFDFRA